ncbi:MAG: hypothetical protein II197_04415 [Peptococcaceae bacterium]|nr:hypothetical protein [Peptococcaceae bacterium]
MKTTNKATRKSRIITLELLLNRKKLGSYTDLTRLKAIMVECFGSVAAAGRATLISQKTLSRRMRGESQFRFDEILRLAYALCMTTQEVHEIFFTRYLEDAA